MVGTNGKKSTINAIFSILKEAKLNCNVYSSPHIQRINERFIFNNQELEDEKLSFLFEEVEKINDNQPITFFEILTACYFYKAAQYPENINLITPCCYENDMEKIEEADWIIEAVPENIDIKVSVYNKIASSIKPTAILSTNTSGITLKELIPNLPETLKDRFIITHFFNVV